LVFTLSATCSDLRGSSPDQAIKLNTCTATANLLFVDISKLSREHDPPFCNHYSYKFDFVNYLCVLGFGGRVFSTQLNFSHQLCRRHNANALILFQIKQVTVS